MIYYIRDEEGSLIGFKYNDTMYYYIKNMQEDIIGITDEEFNKIVEYEYDSWGKVITIKDNNGNIITDESHIGIINPFRYRSYYYDKETKLYYLNSRYYNPEWGRFLNIDSISGEIGDIMSHNMYKYANNNPINFGDEDGNKAKWWQKVLIGVGVIVVGAVVASVAVGAPVAATIVTSVKTAAAIGTVSAVAKGTRQASKSISEGKSAKTVVRETANAALDGFGNGFAIGGAIGTISALSPIGSKSNGKKIGETSKEQYGRITIGYGSELDQGMTIINYSDKSGKSKIRLDVDPQNMFHLHYGNTKSARKIHRTRIMNIIFGVISGEQD